MGLDMYLEKRRKNTNDELQQVIYWRKANAIHNYFDYWCHYIEISFNKFDHIFNSTM